MKTLSHVSIALLSCFVIIVSCSKTKDSQSLTISASYGGGIIAYILQPGDPGYNSSVQHGIIVAPTDQSTGIQWGCDTTLAGASGTAIGTGQANTDSIVSHCGTGTAAYLCHILTLGGYSDWYLPSQDELNKLMIFRANHAPIADLSSYGYWSSTEDGSNYAWCEDFGNGYHYDYKTVTYYVRAVRAF